MSRNVWTRSHASERARAGQTNFVLLGQGGNDMNLIGRISTSLPSDRFHNFHCANTITK